MQLIAKKRIDGMGVQDFNSAYLGKDEENLIPALLENIAEWGNIRINGFRSKFVKNAIFI